MYELSEDEMIRLASVIREQYGQFLSMKKFEGLAHDLFENIPGLECLPDTDAQSLINELWVIYHDRGHYQEDRSKIRCDH